MDSWCHLGNPVRVKASSHDLKRQIRGENVTVPKNTNERVCSSFMSFETIDLKETHSLSLFSHKHVLHFWKSTAISIWVCLTYCTFVFRNADNICSVKNWIELIERNWNIMIVTNVKRSGDILKFTLILTWVKKNVLNKRDSYCSLTREILLLFYILIDITLKYKCKWNIDSCEYY